MKLQAAFTILALLLSKGASAQQVFDSHVHLWAGETSLRQYEAQAKAAGISLVGFGGMITFCWVRISLSSRLQTRWPHSTVSI